MATDAISETHIVRRQREVSEALAATTMPDLLKQLYANRNIEDPVELDYSLGHLLDYRQLKDIDIASAITADAIESGSRIVIIGDYDADGATSTAVIMRALRSFGHADVQYLVPNRFDFGYGLSPEIVDVASELQPDLIITVDNGIASIAGVERAAEYGIPVIVTDHHLAGDELPAAEAILNPNQPGCGFPSKVIAGVGVAFYLMLACRAELRERGYFESREEPNMASLLDLVALGTVADVVPLDANNRLLVEQGLRRIRAGHCSAGIQAIMQVAGRQLTSVCPQDFGFAVGPRLNAAGRLEDMSLGIECLITDDASRASTIAEELDTINRERRNIEADMLQQANACVDEQLESLGEREQWPSALCLYRYDWHQGIVGLLASRVKERIHRPVVAFADEATGDSSETIKGSARSIPGIHIRDALDQVDRRIPGSIIKFGGHAMAAGLTLRTDALSRFEETLQEVINDMADAAVFDRSLESDGPVPDSNLHLESAELLRRAGPWGQGFSEPLFDDTFEVVDWRIVGEKHLKLRLRTPGSKRMIDAIAFNHTDEDLPEGGRVHVAYRMDVNEYNGNRKLQLIIHHIGACIQEV